MRAITQWFQPALHTCLVAMLMAIAGVVVSYGIVLIKRNPKGEIPRSARLLTRGSVVLGWMALVSFFLCLFIFLGAGVLDMLLHPEQLRD